MKIVRVLTAAILTTGCICSGSLKPIQAQVKSAPTSLEAYRISIQRKVMRSYFPPKCQSPGSAHVAFSIEKNGGITCVRLKKSSGCPLYDRCALEAVERAAPYAALPEDRTNLNVAVDFDMGKIFAKKSLVTILDQQVKKSDSTPQTKSASFLTQKRTVKQLCQALREGDFARAQMDVSGLPQEGKELFIRVLFRQIENYVETPGMKDSDSISIIIDSTVFLKSESRAKLHEASKPVIQYLKDRKSNLELKSNTDFLNKLADFFEKVDQYAVYE